MMVLVDIYKFEINQIVVRKSLPSISHKFPRYLFVHIHTNPPLDELGMHTPPLRQRLGKQGLAAEKGTCLALSFMCQEQMFPTLLQLRTPLDKLPVQWSTSPCSTLVLKIIIHFIKLQPEQISKKDLGQKTIMQETLRKKLNQKQLQTSKAFSQKPQGCPWMSGW